MLLVCAKSDHTRFVYFMSVIQLPLAVGNWSSLLLQRFRVAAYGLARNDDRVVFVIDDSAMQ